MSENMTLNVRVSGPLRDFVSANVGVDGDYENVSEYVRDLIRKDKQEREATLLERLKAELVTAFAAPDESYIVLTANDIITRSGNKHQT